MLEPLYDACLERMEAFVAELDQSATKHSAAKFSDFREYLREVQSHPNRRYYILKSIIIGNLYGVDIMDEAVEICKLRLFLKLAAQADTVDKLEPLPDIDFNVRAGNTLVGFTSLDAVRRAMTITPDGQQRQVFPDDQAVLDRIEEEAQLASAAFNQFRWQQTLYGGEVTASDKETLRQRLGNLSSQLDRHLASEYRVDLADSDAFAAWHASHKPFHWFVEFYGTISKGGFDVVIGNPPYVEYSKVRKKYQVRGFVTEPSGNVFALCSERALHLTTSEGRFCFIVPLSLQTTKRMSHLQKFLLRTDRDLWMSSFDVYPCKLFDGAKQRLTILLASRKRRGTHPVWTTRYNRWRPEERPVLFARLVYTPSHRQSTLSIFPKSGDGKATSILYKLAQFRPEAFIPSQDEQIYIHRIPYNYVKAVNFVPYFRNERRGKKKSDDYKPYCLASPSLNLAALAMVTSNLFFFRWYAYFDGYHCGKHEIASFPFGFAQMNNEVRVCLESLADRLMADMEHNSSRKSAQYKATGRTTYQEFYPVRSKPIIDEIDRVLAEHYGFTDEELDFIINYDIKYRMGRER